MCGIAGYIGPREIAPERVDAALGLMRRRGPDRASSRHWTNPAGRHIQLLHSRLSIIDLDERSDQPFRVGRKWIALNGELYNYLELKRDLERRASFHTTSDTEVLLTAIDQCGWPVLDRCEGMWAFAVYDEADGSLTLCRDRFGEKPLYVLQHESGLYFGSEVKFIVALLGERLRPNLDHLCRYMVNGYRALYKRDVSFFEGLQEVPPASTWRIAADGQVTSARYWQPAFQPDAGMTYEQAVAGARERLVRTVELRLRADVPLAFCMSGGVDSNSLISTAKNVFGYDVHGFTIETADERYDEREMVDHVVAELGIRHTTIPASTEQFLPRLRSLVQQHDAPVYTISYYVQWLLMESIAAQGYRVSISGTAADELFSGYYDHHLAYLYDIRDEPERLACATGAWEQHVKPIVRNPYLGNSRLFFDRPELRDYIYLDADAFASFLTSSWRESFEEEHYAGDLLRNRMLNELFHESVPVILHEDDLNAMYYSVENRAPFLDRSLFDFCSRIPTRHLIRDGMAKAVLRDAMRGIVPDAVLDCRRKVGFNVPILSLLDVADPTVRGYLLDDSPIFEHVRRDRIAELIDKADLPNSQSKFLFYFLNSKMFLEEFL